jgi:hypothetical protein
MDLARTIDRFGGNEDLRQVAFIGARIHAQRAADGTRNAAQELEARERLITRGQGNVEVERTRTGHDLLAFDRDSGEAAQEADHHALHAAVANEDVGTDAQDCDGHIRRQAGHEGREILDIGRPEQNLGLSPRAEPGLRTEGGVGCQPSARPGQPVDQVGRRGRECHHAAEPPWESASLAMARGPAFSAASC